MDTRNQGFGRRQATSSRCAASSGISKRLISATNTERALADRTQSDKLIDRIAPLLDGQRCFAPDACNVCVQEVEARLATADGSTVYYSNFIPHYSTVMAPLVEIPLGERAFELF